MTRTEKRTNVRHSPTVVRGALRALTAVSPALSARVALKLFISPRRHVRPDREHRLLAEAGPFHFLSPHGVLRGWSWGEGPVVMLVHGWEGRGAQLGGFVPGLVEAGYRVVTFDGPAHGDSPGRTATPVEVADAMKALQSRVGPVHAVVAHSMGATATAFALQDGLSVERVVFVAGGTHPAEATVWLSNLLDLSPSVLRRMREGLAQRSGTTWAALENADLFGGLEQPLLLVHDIGDRDVPIQAAERVQSRWPGARLHRTAGLGHRRILRDPEVVREVVDFIGPPPARPEEHPWQAFLRSDWDLAI